MKNARTFYIWKDMFCNLIEDMTTDLRDFLEAR